MFVGKEKNKNIQTIHYTKMKLLRYTFLFFSLFKTLELKSQTLITDVGSSNNYHINYPAKFYGTVPPTGFMVTFKAANSNTGPSTLKLNSFSPFAIKKNNNNDLGANDFLTNTFATVIYDGANWQMLSCHKLADYVSGTGKASGVAFWNSLNTIASDSTNFVWDDVNNRLGIGTNTPNADLDVIGSTNTTNLKVNNTLVLSPNQQSFDTNYTVNLNAYIRLFKTGGNSIITIPNGISDGQLITIIYESNIGSFADFNTSNIIFSNSNSPFPNQWNLNSNSTLLWSAYQSLWIEIASSK